MSSPTPVSVFPSNLQRQKVSLVLQIFSEKISAALKTTSFASCTFVLSENVPGHEKLLQERLKRLGFKLKIVEPYITIRKRSVSASDIEELVKVVNDASKPEIDDGFEIIDQTICETTEDAHDLISVFSLLNVNTGTTCDNEPIHQTSGYTRDEETQKLSACIRRVEAEKPTAYTRNVETEKVSGHTRHLETEKPSQRKWNVQAEKPSQYTRNVKIEKLTGCTSRDETEKQSAYTRRIEAEKPSAYTRNVEAEKLSAYTCNKGKADVVSGFTRFYPYPITMNTNRANEESNTIKAGPRYESPKVPDKTQTITQSNLARENLGTTEEYFRTVMDASRYLQEEETNRSDKETISNIFTVKPLPREYFYRCAKEFKGMPAEGRLDLEAVDADHLAKRRQTGKFNTKHSYQPNMDVKPVSVESKATLIEARQSNTRNVETEKPSGYTRSVEIEKPSEYTRYVEAEKPSGYTRSIEIEKPSEYTRYIKVEKPSGYTWSEETEKPRGYTRNLKTKKSSGCTRNIETEKPNGYTRNVETEKPNDYPRNVEIEKQSGYIRNVKTEKPNEYTRNVETEKPSEYTLNVETEKQSGYPRNAEIEQLRGCTRNEETKERNGYTRNLEIEKPSAYTMNVETEKPSGYTRNVKTEKPNEYTRNVETENPNRYTRNVETGKPSGCTRNEETEKASGYARNIGTEKLRGYPRNVEIENQSGYTKSVKTEKPSGYTRNVETEKPSGCTWYAETKTGSRYTERLQTNKSSGYTKNIVTEKSSGDTRNKEREKQSQCTRVEKSEKSSGDTRNEERERTKCTRDLITEKSNGDARKEERAMPSMCIRDIKTEKSSEITSNEDRERISGCIYNVDLDKSSGDTRNEEIEKRSGYTRNVTEKSSGDTKNEEREKLSECTRDVETEKSNGDTRNEETEKPSECTRDVTTEKSSRDAKKGERAMPSVCIKDMETEKPSEITSNAEREKISGCMSNVEIDKSSGDTRNEEREQPSGFTRTVKTGKSTYARTMKTNKTKEESSRIHAESRYESLKEPNGIQIVTTSVSARECLGTAEECFRTQIDTRHILQAEEKRISHKDTHFYILTENPTLREFLYKCGEEFKETLTEARRDLEAGEADHVAERYQAGKFDTKHGYHTTIDFKPVSVDEANNKTAERSKISRESEKDGDIEEQNDGSSGTRPNLHIIKNIRPEMNETRDVKTEQCSIRREGIENLPTESEKSCEGHLKTSCGARLQGKEEERKFDQESNYAISKQKSYQESPDEEQEVYFDAQTKIDEEYDNKERTVKNEYDKLSCGKRELQAERIKDGNTPHVSLAFPSQKNTSGDNFSTSKLPESQDEDQDVFFDAQTRIENDFSAHQLGSSDLQTGRILECEERQQTHDIEKRCNMTHRFPTMPSQKQNQRKDNFSTSKLSELLDEGQDVYLNASSADAQAEDKGGAYKSQNHFNRRTDWDSQTQTNRQTEFVEVDIKINCHLKPIMTSLCSIVLLPKKKNWSSVNVSVNQIEDSIISLNGQQEEVQFMVDEIKHMLGDVISLL
ncbi:myosin light chain kinase, smooth muscle [Plakobranchus ocellatus]|uniref:Myosin light chain kinase, smooth muscle n=1 Tax=Plakobranchus ocellatus TaxID=259542 RepID=A0AAV4BZ44_9GAST|nr:myosin light chain kinase, smooth muscle [Plakobranchus ocellatus]